MLSENHARFHVTGESVSLTLRKLCRIRRSSWREASGFPYRARVCFVIKVVGANVSEEPRRGERIQAGGRKPQAEGLSPESCPQGAVGGVGRGRRLLQGGPAPGQAGGASAAGGRGERAQRPSAFESQELVEAPVPGAWGACTLPPANGSDPVPICASLSLSASGCLSVSPSISVSLSLSLCLPRRPSPAVCVCRRNQMSLGAIWSLSSGLHAPQTRLPHPGGKGQGPDPSFP